MSIEDYGYTVEPGEDPSWLYARPWGYEIHDYDFIPFIKFPDDGRFHRVPVYRPNSDTLSDIFIRPPDSDDEIIREPSDQYFAPVPRQYDTDVSCFGFILRILCMPLFKTIF